MVRASSPPRGGPISLGALLGIIGSLAVHGLVIALLHLAGTLPALDFELTLPSEVEFGMTEPAPAEPSAPTTAPAIADDSQPKPKPRKRKPVLPDAGVSDVEPAEAVAGKDDPQSAGDRPLLSAYAPEGAQIALRLHMGRVRDSELAPEVRELFGALVDFRAILDGSGLDPLRDLERLYLATPDLRRANLVIAGQYVSDPELPERAVASLAAARGEEASWKRMGSVRVAPWHNVDPTPRVLALIAPQQFAITRSEDLPRVLQVARALAERRAKAGVRRDPADALLALDDGETLALSVEGARQFARGNLRGVPERLEASLRVLEDGRIETRVLGFYEDAGAAEEAARYWERVRARYASHPLVALIGLREPLADLSLRNEDTRIELRTQATIQQARVVLGFIRGAIAPPPSDSPATAPVQQSPPAAPAIPERSAMPPASDAFPATRPREAVPASSSRPNP